MKKIFILASSLFFLLSASLVSADCQTPIVRDQNGFPITNCGFPGSSCSFVIDGANFLGTTTNYTLQVENGGSDSITIFIQPSSSLANYISPVTVSVNGNSVVNFYIMVWIRGSSVSGKLDVSANCSNSVLPTLISIPTQLNGKNIANGDPTKLMPSLVFNSGTTSTSTTTTTTSTSTTTTSTATTTTVTTTTTITLTPTTTTTTTTTTPVPINGSLFFNSAGCNFGQIICPSSYSSCTYFFKTPIPLSTIKCDSYLSKPNPGTLNAGESLCPAYDNNKGFSSTTQCQIYGTDDDPPTSATTTTTTSPSTSTTTTTTTTSTTSSTTTTSPTDGKLIFDSFGCNFGQITCFLGYSYCKYFFNTPIPLNTIKCDSYLSKPNPGTLNSGQSLCPAYDNNKGFSSTTQCQIYGFNGIPTTSTTSTSTTTTTKPPATSTTTTTSPPSNSIFDSFGCNFGQIVCPSTYNSCSYQFTTSTGSVSSVKCDSYISKPNPGTLNAGESLCPAYDSNKGYTNAVRCQVFGK